MKDVVCSHWLNDVPISGNHFSNQAEAVHLTGLNGEYVEPRLDGYVMIFGCLPFPLIRADQKLSSPLRTPKTFYIIRSWTLTTPQSEKSSDA